MKLCLVLTAVMATITILLIPSNIFVVNRAPDPSELKLNNLIREFLTEKKSPLAPETEFLMRQKHWRLLIAISAIESQYCKRQIAFNCWGIGGDSVYRHYSSIRAAILDANDLIEHWQERGRWLTVEDMDGHYVVPANPNWVLTVNKVLNQINQYERRSQIIR